MIRRTTGYDTGGQPRTAAIPLTARWTSDALGGGRRSAIPLISFTISGGTAYHPGPHDPPGLCASFRDDLTEHELLRIRAFHSKEVVDTAVYDDGRPRITRPRPGWLRLAGRWDTGSHRPALAVPAEAVAAGDRDLDVASLRSIDPAGMQALLTGIGRVRLRRPNPLVQRLAHFIGTRRPPGTN